MAGLSPAPGYSKTDKAASSPSSSLDSGALSDDKEKRWSLHFVAYNVQHQPYQN